MTTQAATRNGSGTTHRWYADLAGGEAFLRDTLPYLTVKREAAEKALAWIEGRRRARSERDATIVQLRTAKKSLKHIADRVGMTTSGVHDALKRLAHG